MTDKAQRQVSLQEVEDTVQEVDHGQIPTKRFDIVTSADRTIVGGITLRHTDNDYLTLYRGHTGFKIDEAHRRRGYATAALIQVIEHAQRIGMRRIVVTCRHDNTASERTIRKAGLSYEATVDVPTETYLWKHGIKRVNRFSKELNQDVANQAVVGTSLRAAPHR